jgi:deoxyribose-phosphate aldolase
MSDSSRSVVSMIDHAILHPTSTEEQIRAGCQLARQLRVASVCVQPLAVRLAAEALDGSGVGLGTVIGFPHGANLTQSKVMEVRFVCELGAHEVDMVVPIGRVLDGDWKYVEYDIRSVVDMAHAMGAITKVIFETDYLPSDELKIRLCEISERAGAEFVKTSTGFGYVPQADGRLASRGATEHDVRLMRSHVGSQVQVKASGGIRSYADALRMVECGATRLGTSSSQAIAEGERRVAAGDSAGDASGSGASGVY